MKLKSKGLRRSKRQQLNCVQIYRPERKVNFLWIRWERRVEAESRKSCKGFTWEVTIDQLLRTGRPPEAALTD